MSDIIPCDERCGVPTLQIQVEDLERQLAGREREWQQHQDLCKEAQTQNTRERHQMEAQLAEVQAQALLAKTWQARAELFEGKLAEARAELAIQR